MGRPNIAEVGKRFSSEYQPANRGRKKGSRNRRTVLGEWLRTECRTPEQQIRIILDTVFGKKVAPDYQTNAAFASESGQKAEAIWTI